jgi:tetratricopeptide (TPR) repeat protein
MNFRGVIIIFICIFLSVFAVVTKAELLKEQIYILFNQANEAFRQANSSQNPTQADELYEKAILSYEKIINEGKMKNAGLYYNLGNAYLLKENIGKAILNYRRAQKIDSSDANIHKNLEFARSQRIDKITPKARKRIMETLFFWHYDFSLRTKFTLTCLFFAAFCIMLTLIVWLGRTAPTTTAAVITGILTLCFFVSVAVEARQRARLIGGVITAQDVIARQGDGQNYPESFKEPLHEGTEFDVLERRPGWLHIRLSDNNDGWIPNNAAALI